MVNEDIAADESDLHRVVASLLTSRPDLADPNKLRLFDEILKRQIAALNSGGGRILPAAVSTDHAPRSLRPEEKLMWFALHLAGRALPTIFIMATFPRFPLPILPIIVIMSFLATHYLYRADNEGH